jgi:Lar family restriction alleviation protein
MIDAVNENPTIEEQTAHYPRVQDTPCPFCGGTDLRTEHGDYDSTYVMCDTCFAEGPALIAAWTDMCEDEVERQAFALWNKRTPEDNTSVINKLVNAIGNVVDDMTFCVAPSKATLRECTKLLATVGLIQKLRAATGPDRDLDMAIARGLGFRIAASTGGPHIKREGSVASWDLPAYTATAESRADAIKKLST